MVEHLIKYAPIHISTNNHKFKEFGIRTLTTQEVVGLQWNQISICRQQYISIQPGIYFKIKYKDPSLDS